MDFNLKEFKVVKENENGDKYIAELISDGYDKMIEVRFETEDKGVCETINVFEPGDFLEAVDFLEDYVKTHDGEPLEKKEPCISVDTPLGKLIATVNTNPEYPGIFIELDDVTVALVECILDVNNNRVRTVAWNGKEEDYATNTEFHIIDEEDEQ